MAKATTTADGIPVFCAFDEIAPIEAVIGNPQNPNTHPERQVELLAKIIDAQGWRAPITVSNRSGFVVRGHGRLAAARLLGKTEVPLDRQDYADEASEYADLIADNRIAELAELDMTALKDMLGDIDTGEIDMELTGFTVAELEAMLTATFDGIEVKEDTPPPVSKGPAVAKPGEIWLLGPHRLMCGDSTDPEQVARLMNGETAAMLLTDPPYNVAYQTNLSVNEAAARRRRKDGKEIQNDQMGDEDFDEFLRAIFHNAYQHLSPGAPYYVFHADAQRPAFQQALAAEGFDYRQTLIWVKDTFVLGRQDYNWQHEPVLYGWKDGAAHPWRGAFNKATVIEDEAADLYAMKKADLIAALQELREQTTAIREDRPTTSAEHPTMKPTRLVARFITYSTDRGGLIFEPCAGSGSTLIAAGQLRRRCNAMEIDPAYVDVIVQRWERMTGLSAQREEGGQA